MKNLLTLLLFLSASAGAFAQNVTQQSVAPKGSPFITHLMDFSWVYITAFVVLVGFFVMAYLLGWDKKLFKSKAGDDNHMFI
ncbi:MAG: hypothetical protein F9K23_09310 [Bacteroidetes bacterium]|nr:MAG: hypothetical protein F9K23_09310 [Bacteroidota bacterium]